MGWKTKIGMYIVKDKSVVRNGSLDWKGNYEDMGKGHWNGNVDMDGLVSLEMDCYRHKAWEMG